MSDRFSKETRSKIMASIKGKDTTPEIIIRKILWKSGYRYRIHDKEIFGKPDISFNSQKLAIFIDGCFWHGCKKCYREPKTNTSFWRTKIGQNIFRRKKVRKILKKQQWKTMEFWEHDIKTNPLAVVKHITCKL